MRLSLFESLRYFQRAAANTISVSEVSNFRTPSQQKVGLEFLVFNHVSLVVAYSLHAVADGVL